VGPLQTCPELQKADYSFQRDSSYRGTLTTGEEKAFVIPLVTLHEQERLPKSGKYYTYSKK